MARVRRRRQHGTGSVYKRQSDGRWVATVENGWTATGARRRIVLTAKTEAEAKAKLRAKVRDLARGEESTSARTTVKAWAATWLAMTERTARPKTHTTDRGAVTKWIVPTIGHKRLDALTPADVRAVETAVRAGADDRPNSTSTALRYHGVLIRMLKAAEEEGHSVPARVLKVRPPAKAVSDRQALSLDHTLRVLAAASTLPHGSRWVAALMSGMRKGECLGLTWPEVGPDALAVSWQLQALPYRDKHDRSAGFRVPDGYEARQLDRSLHLVRPKSKAGWRMVPLVPMLAQSLAAWREVAPASPHGLVWPGRHGEPRSDDDDRAEWKALQDTAGVRHPSGRYYHRHEARNTAATLLMEGKVPESVRIAIMGHSSIAVTRGYEHVDQAQARKALEQVAERLQLG